MPSRTMTSTASIVSRASVGFGPACSMTAAMTDISMMMTAIVRISVPSGSPRISASRSAWWTAAKEPQSITPKSQSEEHREYERVCERIEPRAADRLEQERRRRDRDERQFGADEAQRGGHRMRTSIFPVFLRFARHSSRRWSTTKKLGTKRTARQVEAIMPVKTVMPIDLRALEPAPVASTSGTTPRMNANDVIRIGPEARTRRLDRGSEDGFAAGPELARHLDDQDRVLRRQRDQQNEPDLHVEIVGDAEPEEDGHRPGERQRHGEKDRDGREPALVLAGEHQIDKQQRHGEDEVHLAADELLLIGQRRPLVAHAGRQFAVGDLVEKAHRLAGREARPTARRRSSPTDRDCRD